MKQISSVDLYFLTKELSVTLENQRIDSIYLEDKKFYLKVYIRNRGNKFLTFDIGKSIYLGEEKIDSAIPSSFISYLRKNLKNGFIRKFEQIENERILKIEIEKKVKEDEFEKVNLYLELFSPGNIILTTKDNIIKNMLFRKKFKDRKVIAKEKYELPPKKENSLFNIDEDKLKIELKESDLSIVKFLAIKLGIGGKFSEEIIFRAKIDKNKLANQIDEDEFNLILLKSKELINSKINPKLILNSKGEYLDFIPFEFENFKEKNKEDLEEFNQVILKYFSSQKENIRLDSREKELKLGLKKLQNRLKKQNQQKEKIFTESEKFTEIGNKIYENYTIVEELLNNINSSAKKIGWEETLKKIKESENEKLKIIEKIDYKKNKIILNLE